MHEHLLIRRSYHEKETLSSTSAYLSSPSSYLSIRITYVGRTRDRFYCDHPSLIGRDARANEQTIIHNNIKKEGTLQLNSCKFLLF